MCPSLRAVLFYLYTGEITFASPNSDAAKGTCKSVNAKELSASAGSVYMAADKVLGIHSLLLGLLITLFQYDIPKLKALALDWIRATIHSCDIVRELASDFTATYKYSSFASVPNLTENQVPGNTGDLSAAACQRIVFR